MKKDWEIKKLGDVCLKRDSIKWKYENSNTEYQYIDLSAVDRESKNITDTQIITKENAPSRAQQIVKTGDILFGTTRPTLKRFSLLSDDYDGQICSTGFCVLRPNQKTISSHWIFYQFYDEKFYKYIEPLQKGANYPAVTDKDIFNFPIPVPPLEEQKRIVKILGEKFAQLETIKANAQTNLQNAKDLFQSQLTKAFSNTTWEKKRLGEVCDVRDGTHDSPKFYDKGYPLVTSKNLKNGKIEMINLKYISKEDYEKINERSKVDINDILFAMIGTIGNPVLVTEEPTYAIKNMALIKDIGSIFPNYLLFYLSSNCALDKMLHDSNGTTQRFVSLNYLRNFEIPLPPLPEQKRIVKELDTLSEKVRQLQEIYTKQIANCDELKQSYLQKAFEGEL